MTVMWYVYALPMEHQHHFIYNEATQRYIREVCEGTKHLIDEIVESNAFRGTVYPYPEGTRSFTMMPIAADVNRHALYRHFGLTWFRLTVHVKRRLPEGKENFAGWKEDFAGYVSLVVCSLVDFTV